MNNILKQIEAAESQGKREVKIKMSKEYKAIDVFKQLKIQGYSPELEDVDDCLFLVIPLKQSKVINLFDYKPKQRVISVEDNLIKVEFGRVK